MLTALGDFPTEEGEGTVMTLVNEAAAEFEISFFPPDLMAFSLSPL